MPNQPLVIFDGRCGFCRIWIEYWKEITGGRVEYAASQEVGDNYPQIEPADFARSVQFVAPDGKVARGARAVFLTLTYARGMAWLLWVYQYVPGFATATEAAYAWIAAHRNFAYQLTRLTFGTKIRPLQTARVEWLFMRALAVVYFAAFASLAVQVDGLIGDRGILPVSRYLPAVSRALGTRAYWEAPTIFWWIHGNRALDAACWIGAAIAVASFFGFLERAALICL
jgi:predicted DCC family thiol-disulfide oxidoreductase YuxK